MSCYVLPPGRRSCAALAWVVLLILFGAASLRPVCAQTQAPPTPAQTAPTPAQAGTPGADRLDINARINVTVAGETDLSHEYTVDTNGNITMLYVNQVHVGGLTIEQARQAITNALKKFYVNPQVVVALINAGGIQVELNGAVTQQGQKVIRSDAHLNDVIQQAGIAVDADLQRIEITHGAPSAVKTKDTVNYLDYLNNQDPAGNPLLHDFDVIFIPRKNVPIQVNIRGEVVKPGRTPVAANTTVYDAIQGAGGLTVNSDRKRITIQHAGSTTQIPFDYEAARQQPQNAEDNPLLLDGDTIIIPSTAKPQVYTLTGAVRQPREYDYTTPPPSFADAVGKAGGLADRARLKEVTIIRTASDGKVTTMKKDFSDPQTQGTFFIQPGDNINIPQGSPGFKPDPLAVLGTLVTLYAVFGRR